MEAEFCPRSGFLQHLNLMPNPQYSGTNVLSRMVHYHILSVSHTLFVLKSFGAIGSVYVP